MTVAVLLFSFHLPSCHGLKEKRAFLKPLKTKLRQDFSVSAAEVAHQDLHQRATLGVAAVGADRAALEPLTQAIRNFVESAAENEGMDVLSVKQELLSYGDVGEPGRTFGEELRT